MHLKNALFLAFVTFASIIYFVSSDCNIADECVTDIEQNTCDGDNMYLVENVTVDNCCPGCKKLSFLKERCGRQDLPECAKGLKCDGFECEPDPQSCWWYALYPESETKYPPRCNPDGTYHQKQCKGDNMVGRCFCANVQGKRIFGLSWMMDSKNMTCACSRRRADLEEEGRTDVTLHCTENGNYEELQCDNGLCWCAESLTGESLSGVVNEELLTQLPCYDEKKVGSKYLRVCESKKYAIAVLKNKLALHGTTEVSIASNLCGYDGTYGIYQVESGIAYCSWKDGKRIGSYQVEAGPVLAKMNCNCARDMKYYEEINQVNTQKCSSNGNYDPYQQSDGQMYCVDSDGFPLTPMADLGVEIDCSIYG